MKSFEDYRRQVMAELQRRQKLAQQEAARRALARQKRRVGGLASKASASLFA